MLRSSGDLILAQAAFHNVSCLEKYQLDEKSSYLAVAFEKEAPFLDILGLGGHFNGQLLSRAQASRISVSWRHKARGARDGPRHGRSR